MCTRKSDVTQSSSSQLIPPLIPCGVCDVKRVKLRDREVRVPKITSGFRIQQTRDCGFGGIVDSESALRSAGALLSRVRAPPPTLRPDGEPESLRSPCCVD
ncbi:hypothetical protein PoB_000150600 [Plakobranchus ocellatus]|uniref:Uncharacterized protein n=1 Tax=Plakobranchus ocellatus TaxID=259542 RepID=A0AAV3XW17_9GAST|nr:hypothetical protein PoB_000150600 [Plakobranchus ocellatus]